MPDARTVRRFIVAKAVVQKTAWSTKSPANNSSSASRTRRTTEADVGYLAYLKATRLRLAAFPGIERQPAQR
jgi:hypothetical protein